MFNRNEIEAYRRGYRILDDGTLVDPKGNKVKGSITKNGYYETAIRIRGNISKFRFHRLQAYQKYGLKIYDIGIVVRHLNGNSKDNSPSNIDIGTDRDNKMDMPREQLLALSINASSYVTKYSKSDVRDIKEYHNESRSYINTMKHFGISSKGTLHFILNKR